MTTAQITIIPDGRGHRAVHVPPTLRARFDAIADRCMLLHVGHPLDDGGYIAGQMQIGDVSTLRASLVDDDALLREVARPTREGMRVLAKIAAPGGTGAYRFGSRRMLATPTLRALIHHGWLLRHPHDDRIVVLAPLARYVVQR